jgi:hypothetical protein
MNLGAVGFFKGRAGDQPRFVVLKAGGEEVTGSAGQKGSMM